MKRTLLLLLLAALFGCASHNHLQVHTEQLIYRGYEQHVRGAGYIYFLQWSDTRGGAVFYSVSDSMPVLPKGFVTSAFLNF